MECEYTEFCLITSLKAALLTPGTRNALMTALGNQEEILTMQSLIHDEIQSLTENAETRKLQEQRSKILGRWAAVDPQPQHTTAFQLRHPLTGLWFTEGDDFKAWLDGHERSLWLSGIRECKYSECSEGQPRS